MIASLVLLVTIIVLGTPTALLFIPWAMITGNVTAALQRSHWHRPHRLSAGRHSRRVRRAARTCPANTACIFMANHVSNLDPPALLPRIPGRTSAFVKRSLMKIPVSARASSWASLFPSDRDGSVHGAQESVAAARRVLEKGIHITTFVEGTRSPRWPHAALQERAVLPGHGNRCALHSGLHPRHRSHDGQRQHAHPARHGAHRLSRARSIPRALPRAKN